MLKKILFLFTIITIVFLFELCKKEDHGNNWKVSPYFKRKALNILHSVRDNKTMHVKGHDNTAITVDTSEQYFIIADFEVDYVDFLAKLNNAHSSFFINAAFATEPPPEPGYMGSLDTIISIKITSNADFDSLHSAGTVLNNLFRIPDYHKSIPLDSLDAAFNPTHKKSFSFIPVAIPDSNFTHNFKVEIILSNGDKFSGETAPVTFKKK